MSDFDLRRMCRELTRVHSMGDVLRALQMETGWHLSQVGDTTFVVAPPEAPKVEVPDDASPVDLRRLMEAAAAEKRRQAEIQAAVTKARHDTAARHLVPSEVKRVLLEAKGAAARGNTHIDVRVHPNGGNGSAEEIAEVEAVLDAVRLELLRLGHNATKFNWCHLRIY